MEEILILAVKYGLPAVLEAVQKWKAANGADPTPEEIRAILEGVEPPKDFSH